MKPLFLFLILTMSITCYGQKKSRPVKYSIAKADVLPVSKVKGVTIEWSEWYAYAENTEPGFQAITFTANMSYCEHAVNKAVEIYNRENIKQYDIRIGAGLRTVVDDPEPYDCSQIVYYRKWRPITRP